jgi:hypothetical protein
VKKFYWIIALIVLVGGTAVPLKMYLAAPPAKAAPAEVATAANPLLDNANLALMIHPPVPTEAAAPVEAAPAPAAPSPALENANPDVNSSPAAVNGVNAAPVAAQAGGGGGVTTTKNKAYDQIAVGPGNLMNNVWGVSPNENSVSGIFLSPDGSFGWYWNRLSPMIKTGQSNVQPIYPSIRIGGNCLERIHAAGFPLRLGDAKSFTFDIAYKYLTAPTGSYDLSYDLFLSEASQPDSKPKIAAEVMIWLDGTAKQPARYLKGEFSDGKNTFELYSWTMADGRAYYSFILKGGPHPQGQFTIHAGKLLDQLKLDSNLLIHGVEFGNEIYNGSGQIQVSQFNINVNGQEIQK